MPGSATARTVTATQCSADSDAKPPPAPAAGREPDETAKTKSSRRQITGLGSASQRPTQKQHSL